MFKIRKIEVANGISQINGCIETNMKILAFVFTFHFWKIVLLICSTITWICLTDRVFMNVATWKQDAMI